MIGHGVNSMRETHSGRHRLTLREPKPVPLSNAFVKEEAKKMGGFPYRDDGEHVSLRTVPADAKEFSRMRRRYKKELGQLRKQWKAAWTAREERQAEQRTAAFAESSARAASLRSKKDSEKLARRALHKQMQARNQQAGLAKKQMGIERTALWHKQVDRRRSKWLDAVEADAETWIGEDEIDRRISAELFQEKYPAHLETYFAASAQRKIADELRQRAQEAAESARALQERFDAAREAASGGATGQRRRDGALDTLAGGTGSRTHGDEDEAGAAALLGLENLAGDETEDDSGSDGQEDSMLRSLRLDAMAARREAREAAATAERHSTALADDDDEDMDVWDSDDWLEREGAARRTQLVDPVEQVEESYRRLASAGLQIAELYHEKPGSGPRDDRDARLRQYARDYLPGARTAEQLAQAGVGPGDEEADLNLDRGFESARTEGWLTNARGEVVVDEGEDEDEEAQLMDAYAHGDVRQVARLLTRKRQRMVSEYPALMAARRSIGEPLEGRDGDEIAAEEQMRLGVAEVGSQPADVSDEFGLDGADEFEYEVDPEALVGEEDLGEPFLDDEPSATGGNDAGRR